MSTTLSLRVNLLEKKTKNLVKNLEDPEIEISRSLDTDGFDNAAIDVMAD